MRISITNRQWSCVPNVPLNIRDYVVPYYFAHNLLRWMRFSMLQRVLQATVPCCYLRVGQCSSVSGSHRSTMVRFMRYTTCASALVIVVVSHGKISLH